MGKWIERFRRARSTPEQNKAREALAASNAMLVQFKESDLPEKAWLARAIAGMDGAQLLDLFNNWRSGMDQQTLSGLIVQHANPSELPALIVEYLAWKGSSSRLAVAAPSFTPRNTAAAISGLARAAATDVSEKTRATAALATDLLKSPGLAMTVRERHSVVALNAAKLLGNEPWSKARTYINQGYHLQEKLWGGVDNKKRITDLLEEISSSLGSAMVWNDKSIWETLLYLKSNGIINIRNSQGGPTHEGTETTCFSLDTWSHMERGVTSTKVLPSQLVDFLALSSSPSLLTQELLRIGRAGKAGTLDLIIEQLADGEPAESTVQALALVSPVLVATLREWCYDPASEVRPALSAIVERRAEWQGFLEAVDRECRLTHPSVVTQALPLPMKRERRKR